VTSKGEIDFKFVLAQPKPTALDAFERLYAIGNSQGKSYALSGLKKLAPERFAGTRCDISDVSRRGRGYARLHRFPQAAL